ncbi:MAG: hypothetical protein ACE14S_07905 [Candidatus Bathyarchaeia archaeon]
MINWDVNNRAGAALALIGLICSTVSIMTWYFVGVKPATDRYNEAQRNLEKAYENLARAYANTPWTLTEINYDVDQKVVSGTYDASTGEWLKDRIYQIRQQYPSISHEYLTATPPTTIEPTMKTTYQPIPPTGSLAVPLEELAQTYANYSCLAVYDIRKYSEIYNEYVHDFGNDSVYARNALDELNYAKIRENDNLYYIDTQINNLVLEGIITHEQGLWLKNRVRELRTP